MIINDELLEPFIKSFKLKNKKIVLLGGCFDVLHDSHIEYIKKAKREGDILILLLESDENIKKLKGKNRPINNMSKRSDALESLGIIDLIVCLKAKVSDKYYYNLTKLISPDIIAITKDDPLTAKKTEQANLVNGKVKEIIERNHDISSSKIINKK